MKFEVDPKMIALLMFMTETPCIPAGPKLGTLSHSWREQLQGCLCSVWLFGMSKTTCIILLDNILFSQKYQECHFSGFNQNSGFLSLKFGIFLLLLIQVNLLLLFLLVLLVLLHLHSLIDFPQWKLKFMIIFWSSFTFLKYVTYLNKLRSADVLVKCGLY